MTQITAKIIAHSKAPNGQEIVTFELQYPRFILAELNTHRLFSRNSASSRAIPIEKMIEQVRNDPAMPVHWGKNQPGMQAKEELNDSEKTWVISSWNVAAANAAEEAEYMSKKGVHKQVANRILEPFQWMKTVLTTTCPDNFFWLRRHTDADPTIHALANAAWEALKESEPAQLQPGDWHTPYFGAGYWRDSGYVNSDMKALHSKRDKNSTLENALAISSSCCAQVSYRKLDDSLEKAKMVYQRLVGSEPVHASPFEHQASPIMDTANAVWPAVFGKNEKFKPNTWQEGVTHVDREGNLWSGNFKGFIQHRQLIPNNVCWDYKE